MLRLFLSIVFLAVLCVKNATTQSYLGNGQSTGITVETSHQTQDPNWSGPANAINTLNGSGKDFDRHEAVRFLMEATLGFEKEHVDDVLDIGFEAWLDQQIQMTYGEDTFWDLTYVGIDPDSRPPSRAFDYAWWNYNMTNDDLLRHRVAFALSEIFVINTEAIPFQKGGTFASYYDILAKNAFGNFEDLLLNVSLSPVMGTYLSHLGNKKANPAENTYPDQNFAREVMQLFSIGLVNLNSDGTVITDANGNAEPTYTNQDIGEFAKVFTGLTIGMYHPTHWNQGTPGINEVLSHSDARFPMSIVEEYHETGIKNLLNGYVIPAGQSGIQDIEEAINHLFMHPNVGPFIGKKLIQFLVKSNPSPQYIDRISQVFNDNGNGVRGDLAAVVKAILLDYEVRTCYGKTYDIDSKLKEPFIRYMHLLRYLPKSSPNDDYCCAEIFYRQDDFPQYIFRAPSVFNFFQDHYVPNGSIADQGLVAPEFQIHNSLTSIDYINFIDRTLSYRCGDYLTEPEVVLMRKYDSNAIVNHAVFEMDEYVNLAHDHEALINELDKHFTHGNLTHKSRLYIRAALDFIDEDYGSYCDNGSFIGGKHLEHKVLTAIYLVTISPDYGIIR